MVSHFTLQLYVVCEFKARILWIWFTTPLLEITTLSHKVRLLSLKDRIKLFWAHVPLSHSTVAELLSVVLTCKLTGAWAAATKEYTTLISL